MNLDPCKHKDCYGLLPLNHDTPGMPLAQARAILSLLGAAFHDAEKLEQARIVHDAPGSEFKACTHGLIEAALDGVCHLIAYGEFIADREIEDRDALLKASRQERAA